MKKIRFKCCAFKFDDYAAIFLLNIVTGYEKIKKDDEK